MATIVLFDVDGTLVSTGGAGRRSLARAFAEVCDAPHALDGISLGGMTDPLILRTALEQMGRAYEAAVADAIIEVYLRHLDAEVPASAAYRVHPGVPDIVERIRALPASAEVAMGLGTGNVEAGARIKLARAQLSAPFAFGGFGSDAEDRGALLRAGVERGAAQRGWQPEACRVVVVGDTPRDVHAAHAIGAVCVAVATGGYEAEQLHAEGADHVFPNLEALGAWEAIVHV